MRVSAAFIAVIAFIICIIMFLVGSMLVEYTFAPLSNVANQTLTGTVGAINLRNEYNYKLWVFFPRIFGICAVLSAIAIPIAYFLDSHRYEEEQYQYQNENLRY